MAKFKEGAPVEQLVLDLRKLVSELDIIKSFEWYIYCMHALNFLGYQLPHARRIKFSLHIYMHACYAVKYCCAGERT